MLKLQGDMNEEELKYVKNCLKNFFCSEEEILNKYREYISNEINVSKSNISQYESDIESIEEEYEQCGELIVGGILFGVFVYVISRLNGQAEIGSVLASLGIGGVSFIYGGHLYRRSERKQETIYSDLDKEKGKLLVLTNKQEKVLNYQKYREEMRKFIGSN